jgi:hypothetical protein
MVQFVGFDGIPSDIMRVMEISYDFNPASDGGHTVTITCAKKETLKASGKFQSIIDEIRENTERLRESLDTGEDQKLGVIISTPQDGALANLQLKSTGAIIKTRSYGLRKPP